MRYPLSEKLEIIRLVERSHLPAKRKLGHLIAGTTVRRRPTAARGLASLEPYPR